MSRIFLEISHQMLKPSVPQIMASDHAVTPGPQVLGLL
jgi:hypothetical protein